MRWIMFIYLFMLTFASVGQIYHESTDGYVRVLANDSTTVIVELNASEFTDVSYDYREIQGLSDKVCYKFGWSEPNGDLINHKGLFVVKTEVGEIYSVWLYEDTKDGRARLSRMLVKNFN